MYNQVADLERSGLTEYVAGCFGGSSGVPLLRDHDFGARLGHGVALAEDPLGLRMSYAIHADQSGLAVVEAYLSGYKAMSIGSCIEDFSRSLREGRNVRRVTRASVAEVSLVRVAAFSGTAAALHPVSGRTLQEAIAFLEKTASASA
jgi:phage head maturation protease